MWARVRAPSATIADNFARAFAASFFDERPPFELVTRTPPLDEGGVPVPCNISASASSYTEAASIVRASTEARRCRAAISSGASTLSGIASPDAIGRDSRNILTTNASVPMAQIVRVF